MSAIDDPQKWILRLFEMEEREGRGANCKRFPDGTKPPNIPLDTDELVFGIYKDRYYFTPASFIMKHATGVERINWRDVFDCSSRHGFDDAVSKLKLVNGTEVRVPIKDFGKGNSGRISQLFHQMIERWGRKATMGPPFLTVDEFFRAADSEYCFAPNQEPHLSLSDFQKALVELMKHPDILAVRLRICDMVEDTPVADAVAIQTTAPMDAFSQFAKTVNADGIISADEQDRRKISEVDDSSNVYLVVWD